MADRIFPNTFKEEPLDSDLVFKGIDWDNFNTKLAEVKSGESNNELPEEFREVLAGKEGGIPQEVLDKWNSKKKKPSGDISKLPGDEDSGLEGYVRKHKKNDDAEDDEEEDDDKDAKKAKKCECGKKPCECDEKESGWDKGSMKKKAFHFTHPSQLTSEAIEAAQQAGEEDLVKAIVAARHERRVRLASKIEEKVAVEAEVNEKLAQRKAYRESLVKTASEPVKEVKVAANNGFVKVSEMNNTAKKAFASKAIAAGFPQEYVDAMLNTEVVAGNDLSEIKTVMASDLNSNVKKAAVSSMVKVATLTNADYDRLVDYWVNELGYGDREWVEALFTKKYDK